MSIQTTILKESLETAKRTFIEGLQDKARQLQYLTQKDPSEALLKRIHKEEKFIKDSIAYHETVTALIEEIEKENNLLSEKMTGNRKKIEYLKQMGDYWMDLYHEIVEEKLKIDYEIEKKLKALKDGESNQG